MPKIIGAGHFIGENQLTNDDLAKIMDTNDEWIYSRTGIKNRGFTNLTNSQMAIKAIENMLSRNANLQIEDIDLIIYATMTPETMMPSQAAKVQKHFGLTKAVCFDLAAACSGFVYGLTTGLSLFKTGNFQKALIIGADKMSSILDENDRSTYVLFGDGAGVILVENDQEENYYSLLGGVIDTNDALIIDQANQKIAMKGQEVYRFAIKYLSKMIKDANQKIGNVDYYIPHQANYRMIESVAKKLKIDLNKFLMNIEQVANTSAGSIPIAISQNFEIFKKGQKIVMLGFGGGLSYGIVGMEIK